MRGLKTSAACRETYGDSAIGYVCLKRESSKFTVKARICPEHRVRSKSYSVILIVDEEEEKVFSVECHDCAASLGGCIHSVAFLMWIHRRTENPAPTEVACYWKKAV
ncbi:uncharacterized protein [Polyergus mexicanus]|uniref:uncharacterized protein n=1 Tax=Polyergus mexicanus TaxID=615972 RepID=UPI0038B60FE9